MPLIYNRNLMSMTDRQHTGANKTSRKFGFNYIFHICQDQDGYANHLPARYLIEDFLSITTNKKKKAQTNITTIELY